MFVEENAARHEEAHVDQRRCFGLSCACYVAGDPQGGVRRRERYVRCRVHAGARQNPPDSPAPAGELFLSVPTEGSDE